MVMIKESLVEIGRKSPMRKCDCINTHHKGVMLVAIDYMINNRKNHIEEIKRKTPENEILNLGTTRKKLLMIPDCPD